MTEQIRDRRKQKFVIVDNPVLLDCQISDAAFRLYCVLTKYAGQDNGCWPGIARLANDTGKGETSIKRLIKELTARGLISRERRFKRSSVTWIEDIEQVYKQSEIDTCAKNGLSAKMDYIEQTKNGLTELDPELNINAGVVSLLTEQGVDSLTAQKLAKTCALEQVESWLAYVRKTQGLKNKAGFLVSRLRKGEFAPEETTNEDNINDSWIQAGALH
jgi:hypothetical protein